jgi:diacylglycerol kinase (ATP)
MTKYRIIVNPVAGKGAGAAAIEPVCNKLDACGLQYDVVCSERPWHAVELARQAAAEGCDIVAGVGGDGTINEILNGLMAAREAGHASPALGVIPVGTGNDFAYSMGIPLNFDESCSVLTAGEKRRIDIGWFIGGNFPEGRYFGNGVGIGFDAVVNIVAHQMKNLNGPILYLAAALKTLLLKYTTPRMAVTIDGETFEQRCVMVSLMNGRRMGGAFLMTPQSFPDDSLFDLCIAGEVSRLTILTMLPRFMKGSQAGHPAIRFLQGREVTIRALSDTLVIHSDGEEISAGCPELTMKLLPGQLEIITSSGNGKPL